MRQVSNVLERFHVAEAARLLNDASVIQNIVTEACADEFNPAASAAEMMREISSLVLATDHSEHTDFVARFRDILAGGIALRTAAHRTQTMQLLLKAADMLFCAKPFFIARQWTCRLVSEFVWQGACLRTRARVRACPPT